MALIPPRRRSPHITFRKFIQRRETMSRQEAVKAKIQDRLEELKTLRDNIRMDLQLASMELRDEWKNLEKKLIDPSAAAEQLRDVTAETIERLAGELRGFRARLRNGADTTVAAIMTRSPITCAPDNSLAQAVTMMWDRDIGWLPVVDGEGHVAGVITDRDAVIAACTRGKRLDELQVGSVMSNDVAACTPEASPQEALALLRSRRLHRLAVVSSTGQLAGVVTLNDVVRALERRLDGVARAGGPHEIVHSLAIIAEPRAAQGAAAN
jgi:CBS domain-containing protein